MKDTLTAEYDRLVGRWVLQSSISSHGLGKAAKFQEFNLDYTKHRHPSTGQIFYTKKVTLKQKFCGIPIPVGPQQSTFALLEDKNGQPVLERKYMAQAPRQGGLVHYRERLISLGDGVFQESLRGGMKWEAYPKFSESNLDGYVHMELDPSSQMLTVSQRKVYGGVVHLVRKGE